jgi:uncharacterized membrane protein
MPASASRTALPENSQAAAPDFVAVEETQPCRCARCCQARRLWRGLNLKGIQVQIKTPAEKSANTTSVSVGNVKIEK